MGEFSYFDWLDDVLGLMADAKVSATEGHVLIRLSRYADFDTGRNAHPGEEGLMRATGASESTVQRAMRKGVTLGVIELVSRGGGDYASNYTLTRHPRRVHPSPVKGAPVSTPVSTPVTGEPLPGHRGTGVTNPTNQQGNVVPLEPRSVTEPRSVGRDDAMSQMLTDAGLLPTATDEYIGWLRKHGAIRPIALIKKLHERGELSVSVADFNSQHRAVEEAADVEQREREARIAGDLRAMWSRALRIWGPTPQITDDTERARRHADVEAVLTGTMTDHELCEKYQISDDCEQCKRVAQ